MCRYFFIISLFSFSFLFPSKIFAQSKTEKLIRENFKNQEDCWNKGDLICYCEAYVKSDLARTINSGGITYGVDSILADYKRYWPSSRMGKLHFDQLRIEKLTRKIYFVSGRFNLEMNDGNKPSGYFSTILKKVRGKWLIYTDHSG